MLTTLLFASLILLFKNSFDTFLGIPYNLKSILYYTIAFVVLDSITAIPFLVLRMQRKALKFSLIRISNIVLNVALNIIFIVILRWGIESIFIANAIASLFNLLLLIPSISSLFTFDFDFQLLKRFLNFGLPFLPAGIAAMVIQVIDRPIMEHLTDMHTLGIYQANYRLGIFMMLFVNMFQYAWQPFFMQESKEANAKETFSKVFTLFTITGSVILVFLSLFIKDIITFEIAGKTLIGKAYWEGVSIVPIILLAYIFNGFNMIFSAGFYIKEKSVSIPWVMGVGAVVNIVANFLLIPVLGITGAALSTLLSYIIIAIGVFYYVQKIYMVTYEYYKIIKLFIVISIIGVVYYSFSELTLIIKFFLTFFFLFSLVFLKIIEQREIEAVKKLFIK